MLLYLETPNFLYVTQLSASLCYPIIWKFMLPNYLEVYVTQLSGSLCYQIIRKFMLLNYQEVYVTQLSGSLRHQRWLK